MTFLASNIKMVVTVVALAALGCANLRATQFDYVATLSGGIELPPNSSPGVGIANVSYDDVTHTLVIDAQFSGLLGTTTASHIHSATALLGIGTAGIATPVPAFPDFPLGVTSG